MRTLPYLIVYNYHRTNPFITVSFCLVNLAPIKQLILIINFVFFQHIKIEYQLSHQAPLSTYI